MDKQTTIRLSDAQMGFIKNEAERLGLRGQAEVIRRIIDDYRAPGRIIVPLEGAEKEFIESMAEELGETPGKAIRISLVLIRTLMQAPLYEILKPPEEIIEEMARRDQ